jgi:tRNA 2-thiouridine synthesizing protein A
MSISNLSLSHETFTYDRKLDTCGLKCPLPLLKTKQALFELPPGKTLWVISTQASLALDLKTLIKQTHDKLLRETHENELFHFWLLKQ